MSPCVVKEYGVIIMMWGYDMSGMGWWMIVSSIVWLGLIALAVWAFARWASRPSPRSPSSTAPTATEILRQRYARGEIESDTFERMRRQLELSHVEQRAPATVA
jgi:putative membrane protein